MEVHTLPQDCLSKASRMPAKACPLLQTPDWAFAHKRDQEMRKFRVTLQEVWVRTMIVEAETEAGARVAAADCGETAQESFEYGYTMEDAEISEVKE